MKVFPLTSNGRSGSPLIVTGGAGMLPRAETVALGAEEEEVRVNVWRVVGTLDES